MAAELPTSRHVEISGAAHFVPLEQPGAATKLILDFAKGLGPA